MENFQVKKQSSHRKKALENLKKCIEKTGEHHYINIEAKHWVKKLEAEQKEKIEKENK